MQCIILIDFLAILNLIQKIYVNPYCPIPLSHLNIRLRNLIQSVFCKKKCIFFIKVNHLLPRS